LILKENKKIIFTYFRENKRRSLYDDKKLKFRSRKCDLTIKRERETKTNFN